ncbi:MAG: hypothetical protein A4E29_00009 [Methanomassiliicoccales archaeon PtaB.Bin134]|nr:MAG: hypothetical protein A4E29_00009 [Methanomassiliicoccales archaeon PtaB.Bin134]
MASCCCVTVFPVPKPPGMAPVPPLVSGNRVSSTRCPVMSGSSGAIFLAKGRPRRTGHFCIMRTSLPSMTATISSTVNSPDLIMSTFPEIPGGTMTLWVMARSGTVPMTCPSATVSPCFTTGVNGHFRLWSRPGAETPLSMKFPILSMSTGNGLWIPS